MAPDRFALMALIAGLMVAGILLLAAAGRPPDGDDET
jgi:hypothetical protein